MAWDASRPVPWQRMVREWLIYVAIMLVLIVLLFRDQSLVGVIAGLLVSGPLYLGIGYVLAKLGYQRKSWKELRSERPDSAAGGASKRPADEPAPGPRPKPAPTSRTGGAPTRPGGRRKRR